MNKFTQSFKNKNFKYGSYSAIAIFIVVAILVVLNLVVSSFDLKLDLTKESIYTLSDASKEIASGVSKEINIYALFKTGEEDKITTEILSQYADCSPKIHVIYKDPYIYPQFVESYKSEDQTVYTNSIIVESEKIYKIINPNELFTSDYNSNSTDIQVEPKITSAIQYVTSENIPCVYYVNGHNEMPIPETLKSKLSSANYEVKNLNILKEEKVPQDCKVLILSTPEKDYTKEEADKIKNYLTNDGNAIVLTNYSSASMPNFESIITAYGIETNKSIIVDPDPACYIQNNPTLIIPTIESHEITKSLTSKNYMVLLPMVQGLNEMQVKKATLKIEPLLSTSSSSYGKNSLEAKSLNKEAGDINGPFTTAFAVTDENYTDTLHQTKLVVVGNSDFVYDQIDMVIGGNNSSFLVNAVKWLSGNEETTFISPKSVAQNSIVVTGSKILIISFVSCLLIPIVLFAAGLVVWLRRRNK